MIYARIVRDLTEESRLEVDAILGDVAAQQRRNEMRRETLIAAGVEIG